jgi:hypothetical protein
LLQLTHGAYAHAQTAIACLSSDGRLLSKKYWQRLCRHQPAPRPAASGRALLERVQREELDPRSVIAAYQQWYSPTLAAMGVLLLERRAGFEACYRRPEGGGFYTPCIAGILASPPLAGERKAGLARASPWE